MKKKVNDVEEKFMDFLQVVNLFRDTQPYDLRAAMHEEIAKIGDDSTLEEQNAIARRQLTNAVTLPFALERKRELLCQFLFKTSSIDNIRDSVHGIARNTYEITLFEAQLIYNSFYSNLMVFRDVMHAFESNHDRNLWHIQSRIDLPVTLTIDSERNVLLSVDEKLLFYGFRDFRRVKRCPVCQDYFLALRTDAKYCSETCGIQARHATLQTKRKGGIK